MSSTKGKTYLTNTVGRRKSSVARVYMSKGTGKLIVNKREFVEYFPKATDRYVINQPMNLLKNSEQFDVYVNVKGGGTTGQAGAIRHGISRALLKMDENCRPELRAAGFLTRDSRKVERKKPGLAGARKKFQFSKR